MKNKKMLDENEEFIKRLCLEIKKLEFISSELKEKQINIENKPWYLNLLDIYVKQAFEFYRNCKKESYDVKKENRLWLRMHYNSFVSNIEKFMKFFIKQLFPVKKLNFYNAINYLDEVVKEYSKLFSDQEELWIESIYEIKNNLHSWRSVQNKNKHDEEHMESNYYDDEIKRIVIDEDPLVYVTDFITFVLNPLLRVLVVVVQSRENQNKFNK